jgi:hypothetical protein
MKMGSKVVFTLLAVVLALPVQGFAEDKAADAPKPAPAAAKPVIAAPTDCVVTGKNTSSAVTTNAATGLTVSEKRKHIHASKGLKSGEEKLVVHNHEAAHEHGRQQ